MPGDFVDMVELNAAAKAAPKSVGRLTRLSVRCLGLVRRAAPLPFAVSTSLQLVGALLLASQVWAVQIVLARILEISDGGAAGWALVGPVAILAGLTALTALATAMQGYVTRYLAERVARVMQQDVLATATAVPLRSFEASDFYDRLQRVQANAVSRPYQVTQGLVSMVGTLASSIAVGLTLLRISPLLLPLLLLGGLPLLVTNRRESRREFAFNVEQTPNVRLRSYLAFMQADRDAAKEVRSFALASPFRRRMDAAYEEYLGALKGHLVRRGILSIAGNVGAALLLAATLGVLVWQISLGNLDVAEAGAAIVAIRLLQGQIQGLFGSMQTIFESGLFLDDVEEFLQGGRQLATQELAATVAPSDFRTIHIDDVTFSYPGTERPALDGVTLEIRRGEVVALVGENGSGKTTLAKLMAGLYEPNGGTVRWDGADIRTFSQESLRARVAVIFQDFVQWALSVEDNIALGAEAEHARVVDAAAAAGAAKAIEALPHRYQTILSRLFKGGRDLSGGQWQRVAIARAFYRTSPLVILDEPTSALDPRAEHDLFESLRRVLDGRTGLFISHRFSTVRGADRIIVMDNGRVVESGNHERLMALGGLYAELFSLQAEAYTRGS